MSKDSGEHMMKHVALILALQNEGGTVEDLSEACGFSLMHTRKWVRMLYTAKPKLIHVAAWSSPSAAFYAWGSKKDAPRPPKKSRQQIDKERRGRQRLARAHAALTSPPIWEDTWG